MLKPIYLSKDRIFGLDIIRAVAIILVVFYHVLLLCPTFSYKKIIGEVASISGVELFFTLSGFLIGGILLKFFLSSDHFSLKTVFNFWKRRWMRTIPLFWFMLLLNTFCVLVFFDSRLTINFLIKEFLMNLLFIRNFITPYFAYMGTAWSLAIEEWSYLLLPVGVLVAYSVFNNKSREKVFIVSVALIIFLSLIVRLLLHIGLEQHTFNFLKGSNVEHQLIYGCRKFVVLRLDASAYGVMLSYFWYKGKDVLLRYKFLLIIPGILLLFLAVYLLVIYFIDATNNIFSVTLGFPLISIAFCFLFPAFIAIRRPKRYSKIATIIESISIVSYSIYLVHDLIWGFYHKYFPFVDVVDLIIGIPSFLILSYFLSVITYNYIERPGMNLRHKQTVVEKTTLSV